jgi:hypothetical protein
MAGEAASRGELGGRRLQRICEEVWVKDRKMTGNYFKCTNKATGLSAEYAG